MSSFADDMPELYPTGTADAQRNELKKALEGIDKIVFDHPHANIDEQHRLIQQWCKDNRYSVSWAKPDAPMQVFIASTIAPELDCYIDVAWPEPGTVIVEEKERQEALAILDELARQRWLK